MQRHQRSIGRTRAARETPAAQIARGVPRFVSPAARTRGSFAAARTAFEHSGAGARRDSGSGDLLRLGGELLFGAPRGSVIAGGSQKTAQTAPRGPDRGKPKYPLPISHAKHSGPGLA